MNAPLRETATGALDPWPRALLALRLLEVDPGGLGGLWLRARAGPSREHLLRRLSLPMPLRRVPLSASDDALFGGTDLTASLAEGRHVRHGGLLASPAALLLVSVERLPQGRAGRLGTALDARSGHCVIALDEGEDEALEPALADRLALHVDLPEMPLATLAAQPPRWTQPDADRPVEAAEAQAALTRLAAGLGIASLRPPLLALRAARAHAALNGRHGMVSADLAAAASLVLAPRGQQPPEAPDDETRAEEPPDAPEEQHGEDGGGAPEETLVSALRASLPPDLLARLAGAARRSASGSGSGGARTGNRRGRPLPSRNGPPGSGRIDVAATLRAAAPFQALRGRRPGDVLALRKSDLRLRRYRQKSDRLVIFAVDASGSTAMARLGEAKGAVELLLAEAYARRDLVALIAFRNAGAELLLPPTRSLVQTKRRLAALPGGGGTPLAAGLRASGDLAATARLRGLTPAVVLLTDGRPNVALDGTADRARAAADAVTQAQSLRAQGIAALVIDTGPRPAAALAGMAAEMGARCIAMPRADARQLSCAVTAAFAG